MSVKTDIMQQDKSKLMSFAMQGGIFLGIFWVVKYFSVVVYGAHASTMLQFVQPILSAFTAVILFQNLIKYRVFVLNNVMSFWHGVQFSIMLFFFASLFESVAAFIHITWIDPQYVSTMYASMVDLLKTFNISESVITSFENQPIPDGLGYIVNHVILSDILIGIMLSLLLVPISKMINPKNITTNQSEK